MENLGKDVLSVILTYVPYELVQVISSPNPLLQSNISFIRDDNLFWKKRAELLFGKQLDSRRTDWKIVYKNLIKVLTNPSLSIYLHDPILYCISHFDTDPSLNKNYLTDTVSVLVEVGYDPSENNNQAIQHASFLGNIRIVKLLLQDSRVDPSINDNIAIANASFYGHTPLVKLLLQDARVNPSGYANAPIRRASGHGHTEIVRLLLQDPRVDPSDVDNEAIQVASSEGHTEIVKMLLQDARVDPSADNNVAIIIASSEGHTEIVRLLLQDPRVDPSANENQAVISASNRGKSETVKLLLKADVLDKRAVKIKKLSTYIREYIKDSLSGLLAMHFLYQNVNSKNKHIYKDPAEKKDNFISLYYQFLRYLVRAGPSMYNSINHLRSLISRKDLKSKIIILKSVKNILYYEKNALIRTPQDPLVGIFTGYFMLSFNPPYTYKEILTKLRYSDKYMMSKLIGAKIGLKRLIENGLQISTQVKGKIENLLNINLIDILN